MKLLKLGNQPPGHRAHGRLQVQAAPKARTGSKVKAIDEAGNAQANIATRTLTVY